MSLRKGLPLCPFPLLWGESLFAIKPPGRGASKGAREVQRPAFPLGTVLEAQGLKGGWGSLARACALSLSRGSLRGFGRRGWLQQVPPQPRPGRPHLLPTTAAGEGAASTSQPCPGGSGGGGSSPDELRRHLPCALQVTSTGAAARDGRLKVGKRILEVNHQSLLGLTHTEAVQILRAVGDTLLVLICDGFDAKAMAAMEVRGGPKGLFSPLPLHVHWALSASPPRLCFDLQQHSGWFQPETRWPPPKAMWP